MAQEFIASKGFISLDDAQITGSLSVTGNISASIFTGSFVGDGSQLTGVSAGFPFTGSAQITGSLTVTGSISTDTDANINSLTVGKGGGNIETNTVLGYEALISNVEGEGSVAIGYKALSSSLAGMGPNTAVGNQALVNNVYGFRNTAVGSATLFSNTGGGFNTAVGNTALVSNIDGNENIAIGDGALNDNTGGDNNTGVGTFAIHSNTSGSNNTAIGHSALYNNLTGSNNTVIGTDAGYYAGSGFTSLESIYNSILLGYQARALNATGDTNEIVIGYNVVGSGSNTTVIGNNSTVSTTLKGAVSASIFSGSFVGDGSQLSGIEGFPFTGSAGITGSLTVVGPVNATSFTGSLQGTATSASYIQLANVDGFTAYSASVNTAIDSVLDATTPLTATVNTGSSPFTLTSQSIVVADSTDGNLTINLPDLNTIVGTPNQKPIVVYKNDYSQNVIYVNPSGSQLVNGASQDIIVSIQLAVIYNPTSAGWVTEGTSAQSLAELELFFLPLTETGSLATTGSNTFIGNQIVTGSLTVTGGINATITGSASSASYVEYTDVANKPALVSSSAQIVGYNIFATTGSNQFNGSQAITGSLTVTGQVVAQTLNVQQVTSSIVYSSGSNIFGNSLSNTQQFTGSVSVTGSLAVNGAGTFAGSVAATNNVLISLGSTSTASTGGTLWLTTNNNTERAAAIRAITQTTDNAHDLLFFTNSSFSTPSERVRITSGGNVGIGTTSPIDFIDAGLGLAIINTTGRSGLSLGSTQGTANEVLGRLSFTNTNSTNIGSKRLAYISGIRGTSDNSAYLEFGTADNALGTQRMVISQGGNVGIGTDNPGQKLEVVGGEIKAGRVDSSNEGGQLSFGRASDNATAWYIDAFGSTSTPDLRFVDVSNSAVRMTITSAGIVDISGPLVVKGTLPADQTSAAVIDHLTSKMRIFSYGASGTTGTFEFRNAAGGAGSNLVATINASGVYTAVSDINKKKDFEDSIIGLNAILGLKPTLYRMRNDESEGEKELGFIAQEVKEFIPQAYVESGEDDDKFIGLNYNAIVAALVKSVQEQQSQIESLKAEIQTLKQ